MNRIITVFKGLEVFGRMVVIDCVMIVFKESEVFLGMAVMNCVMIVFRGSDTFRGIVIRRFSLLFENNILFAV